MARNLSTNVVNFGSNSLPTRGDIQKSRSTNSSSTSSGSSSSSSSAKKNDTFASKILKGSLQNFVNAYRDVAEAEQARNEALKKIVEIDNYFNPSSTTTGQTEMSEGLKKTDSNTNALISAIRDGIFSARGINSINAANRRDQVMQILNGKNLTTSTATTNTPAATEETSAEDVVEYTYKPGDTFGQVIKNLGLQTDNGLWGPNGDVAYYTQQLAEQGAMNSRGNIPIGTTIRLVRRK